VTRTITGFRFATQRKVALEVPAAFRWCAFFLTCWILALTACRAHTSNPSTTSLEWPLLVDQFPELDTSRVVIASPDSFRLYRTDISLSFKEGVSDSAKAGFFERHAMRVIGVTQTGRFFVRIPDQGPTVEALNAVIESLRREPEVALASSIPRENLPHR
jgi:hypothetical protein